MNIFQAIRERRKRKEPPRESYGRRKHDFAIPGADEYIDSIIRKHGGTPRTD